MFYLYKAKYRILKYIDLINDIPKETKLKQTPRN